MRRLSVLAIVLTLGVGPNSASLCYAWCVGDNRAAQCHETLVAAVAADCCDSPAPALTAVFGNESRQEIVSPGPHTAAAGYLLEPPAAAVVRHLQQFAPLGLHANSTIAILRI